MRLYLSEGYGASGWPYPAAAASLPVLMVDAVFGAFLVRLRGGFSRLWNGVGPVRGLLTPLLAIACPLHCLPTVRARCWAATCSRF